MKAIIPTGGRGTRMQPVTFSTNKHFIPVANKPLIYYPIEAIAETGIKEVLITYNPGWLDVVKSYLGTGKKWGLKFTFVLQEEPLGLADIVRSCEKHLKGQPFCFHLGDNIFTDGIVDLYKHFLKEKPNALVAMVKHPDNHRLGVPYFDKNKRVTKIIEKPKNPPHKYAMPGIYFADNNFFKAFNKKDGVKPSKRGEWEIPDPFTWMIKHKYKVLVKEYTGRWLDPGKFGDWIEANEYLLDTKLISNVDSKVGMDNKLKGRVEMAKGTILQSSVIVGPTSIATGTTIRNSYIGPYTSIDENVTIDNSHVENSVVMKGVVIKNIKQPVNESLIGTDAQVVDENGPTNWIKLFIGEKSKVSI